MDDVWITIDTKTDRIIHIGNQTECQLCANTHRINSGNRTVIRTLKTGMVVKEY